jgi:hypothetical protein
MTVRTLLVKGLVPDCQREAKDPAGGPRSSIKSNYYAACSLNSVRIVTSYKIFYPIKRKNNKVTLREELSSNIFT